MYEPERDLAEYGTLQAVISGAPVNYQAPSGLWVPVSAAVRPSSRPGYQYQNVTNVFQSYFGSAAGGLVRFDAPGGGWLELGLAGGQVAVPTVSGDTVTYRGVAAGVSLASLRFTVRAGGGLSLSREGDGSVAVSRGGVPVLRLPALAVSLSADAGWLGQAFRRFPVTVDPTVQIAPTPTDAQNTMIEADAPSGNFSSAWPLSVGTTSTGAVRSLLSFPLSAVPAGTQIDSADLRLYRAGCGR
jgi:hypothetical protein